jgi:hypothetical protein
MYHFSVQPLLDLTQILFYFIYSVVMQLSYEHHFLIYAASFLITWSGNKSIKQLGKHTTCCIFKVQQLPLSEEASSPLASPS